MKKQFITRVFLSSLVLALTSLFGGGNLLAQTTDVLTATKLGVTTSGYESFKPYTGESGVIYNGVAMLYSGNNNDLQLNKKPEKNVGIVTTTSNCFATKIVVTWGQYSNTNNKSLTVYGKKTAYTSSSELYSSTPGDELGKITYTTGATTTSLVLDGTYSYIGLLASGAIYIDKIEITWEASGDTRANPGISFSATSCDVQIGNLPYKFPELNNPNSLTGIKYASSEPTIATIVANSGVITLTGEVGQTTISAEFSGNDEYKGGKVEYTLNVSKASAYIYKKVTATDDIMDGGQYIIVCEDKNLAKGSDYAGVSVTVDNENGQIDPNVSGTGVPAVYTFEAMDGGYALKIGNKQYLSYTTSNSANLKTVNEGIAWTVTIDKEGNAVIQCNESNNRQILVNETNFKNYASSNKDYNKVQLYQKVYPLTVSSATGGYATFYNEEEAYKMPEGLTGYAVTKAESEYITRKTAYEAGATVPAKTPLLIIGTTDGGNYYPAVVSGTGVEAYAGSNLLEGTRDANGYTSYANDGSVYYYKLGLNAEKLGFYWGAENGAAFKMTKATTAYLAVPKKLVESANALFFDFGPETGINEIQTEQANKAIFDLSGRRVQKATKGFYIVGGKKVLVK